MPGLRERREEGRGVRKKPDIQKEIRP